MSSRNKRTYQRLKLALSLGLRRQILIAVCDNLSWRDRIASKLCSELGHYSTQGQADVPAYPKLVSLELNSDDPNFLAQIVQWYKQYLSIESSTSSISFQILGIERLSRKPDAQQRFLKLLQVIECYLPKLESNLLLWLPRSWFERIQQSVPEFWQWHTGVFVFQGKPKPVPTANSPQLEASPTATQAAAGVFKQSLRALPTDQPETTDSAKPLALPPLHSLEDVERLRQQSYPPAMIAAAFIQLGNRSRDRIAQGDASLENLTIAIKAYEQGLQWGEDNDTGTADVLNDLGNFYWMLSRRPEPAQQAFLYLEQAIQSYQLALEKLTREESAPKTYAMIQNNLGAAYSDLARYQDSAENLQKSIRAYEQALRYRFRDTESLKYGSTQNNLGTAYWHLAQQQHPVRNLQAAIAAYNEALAQYHPEREPLNWAMTQNNLGTAYWNLAQYEQPEIRLHYAIQCYQNALKYRTPEIAPAACAATQNNLGTAYWHYAEQFAKEPQKRQAYYQRAIAAYEKAIILAQQLKNLRSPVPANFDLLAAHNNLGLVHYQLAIEPQFSLEPAVKSVHLEAALNAHLQVLQSATAQPDSYQTTFNYIVKTIRAFYRECGMTGQNFALSKIPGQLLPKLLPRL